MELRFYRTLTVRLRYSGRERTLYLGLESRERRKEFSYSPSRFHDVVVCNVKTQNAGATGW